MENSAIKVVKSTELLCHEFNQWYCCYLTLFLLIFTYFASILLSYSFPPYIPISQNFSVIENVN